MTTSNKIQPILVWYWNTSALVGVPVLFILLVMGFDRTVSTVTCQLAGTQCNRAIGALPTNVKISLPGYTSDEEEEDIEKTQAPPKKKSN